ncbi:MAG: lipopolysaccharide heptosyltransferase II [Ignavibacteriales bacterium]|nr:lipopolysaccharide heptosyltransferase II [Ignavibacteriales bacterium]
MNNVENILVVQTAFIGDVVLTLPLVQALKEIFPQAFVDIVVTPRAKELCANHPSLRETIAYDKRGSDRGVRGLFRMVKSLRQKNYQLAIVPHRSLRSALLAWLLRIPVRIGFDKSSGRLLLTKTIKYRHTIHEIERNLSLLGGLEVEILPKDLPRLYPSSDDCKVVDKLLFDFEVGHPEKLVALAPGTIWNTKRWLKERFASLAVNLDDAGFEVMLIGGKEDEQLCDEIYKLSGSAHVYNVAGRLSLLQSAELLRRCKTLVSNDSAPMHIAVAMRTPVVAIFGATVPEFGFGPAGEFDAVVEIKGLPCRPCSIHGGNKCPITTFECMNAISYEQVFEKVKEVVKRSKQSASLK